MILLKKPFVKYKQQEIDQVILKNIFSLQNISDHKFYIVFFFCTNYFIVVRVFIYIIEYL